MRRIWRGLDWCGHRIPFLRFGLVRHWICGKVGEEEG